MTWQPKAPQIDRLRKLQTLPCHFVVSVLIKSTASPFFFFYFTENSPWLLTTSSVKEPSLLTSFFYLGLEFIKTRRLPALATMSSVPRHPGKNGNSSYTLCVTDDTSQEAFWKLTGFFPFTGPPPVFHFMDPERWEKTGLLRLLSVKSPTKCSFRVKHDGGGYQHFNAVSYQMWGMVLICCGSESAPLGH